MRKQICTFVGLSMVAAAITLAPRPTRACGCVTPPLPDATQEEDFAVNQKAEQIVFEVGPGTVAAHVLVRFEGNPESFAWLVPVPNIVDVQLSESLIFPLLDDVTRPTTIVGTESLCPSQLYRCDAHADCEVFGSSSTGTSGGTDGGATAGLDPGADATGVDGIDLQLKKQIGSYEIVAFSADEATLAVSWLQNNGFVVNESMSPYMQPYIERGMDFVAAKLVPGAGVDEIRPLKLVYEGEHPMIPLKLTAVAAEPHMPIVAYIYGETTYGPMAAPVIEVDTQQLAGDPTRSNYSALLARTLDEHGGAGFTVDYAGTPPGTGANLNNRCCSSAVDTCGLADNGSCECPSQDFDHDDCREIEGLVESIELLQTFARHRQLTRLTTLMSPEEMTFDPMFMPRVYDRQQPHTTLQGKVQTLNRCESDVVDQESYKRIRDKLGCADRYCGPGSCAWTLEGNYGCSCPSGFVARSYANLEGEADVTCVPEVPPADIGLGIATPDICAGISCGEGTCIDVGGFPSCLCTPDQVAVLSGIPGDVQPVRCRPQVGSSGDSGARNYSAPLADLEVCYPRPPICGPDGWLVPNRNIQREGSLCERSLPDPKDLIPPPPPECAEETGTVEDDNPRGCRQMGEGGLGGLLGFGLFMGLAARRQRRSTARSTGATA